MRSLHLTLVETSLFYGAITLFGGCLGILAGGVLADRLGAAQPLRVSADPRRSRS